MKKVYEEGEDIGVGTGRAAMHFLLSVGGGGTGSKSNDGGKGKKKGDDNNDNIRRKLVTSKVRKSLQMKS